MNYQVKVDNNNLPIQLNNDAGDCAARTGELFAGLAIRKRMNISNQDWPEFDWQKARMYLYAPDIGVVYRYNRAPFDNPYDGMFGSSRDQTMPMVIAAAYNGDRYMVEGIWQNVKNNYMRCPNGDPCGPIDIAVFKRCLYLVGHEMNLADQMLIRAGDVQAMGSVLVRCSQAESDPDDVGDDINLTIYLALSCDSIRTRFSETARGMYARRRPNYIFKGGNNRDKNNYIRVNVTPVSLGIQFAFDHYHRPEAPSFGNPFNELWRPIIRERFLP